MRVACILTVNERLLSAISRHWLTVNATSKPPHLGASRAYLDDVTAAEFCEEGGHELEVGEAEFLANFYELRVFEDWIVEDIQLEPHQNDIGVIRFFILCGRFK